MKLYSREVSAPRDRICFAQLIERVTLALQAIVNRMCIARFWVLLHVLIGPAISSSPPNP